MIIITGASDGLGLAIGKLYASMGKKVVSLSRTRPPEENIDWIKTDLTDEKSILASSNSILENNETIEALINCAAITVYEELNALTPSGLDRMFRTNVTAPMLLTSMLLERIKKDNADIVNVGATIALKSGYAQQATYSTTKWALRGFTQNLSDELKSTPCRVISFILGGFNSKMHEKVTGKPINDPENWMDAHDLAKCLVQTLEMPKNMEISEIIINRKARR